MSRQRKGWVLPVSILFALLLALLPLPASLQPVRPYWLALVLAYWVIEAPDRIGLGFVFVIGLFADITSLGLLGEQATRLVVIAFILQRFRLRFRFFPLSQQAAGIGLLLLGDRLFATLIHLMVGVPVLPWTYWFSPVIGMLLWPLLFVLLDRLRLGRRT